MLRILASRSPVQSVAWVDILKFDPTQPRDPKGQWTKGGASITVGGREIAVVKPQRAAQAGDVLVSLDVASFDQEFQREQGFYLGKGGQGGIGTRYERFGKYAATHDSIEAAEISVQENGRVGFTNGRHRYAWLRDQGLSIIPVAMTKESVKHAKRYGYLSTVKQAWDESQHPRDAEGQFTTFYHGTLQEQIDSIKTSGLQTNYSGLAWPGLSQPGTIYLGRTKETAMLWAESTTLRLEWKFENPTAVVLEVRVPDEVLAKSQRTAEPEGNLRVFQDIPPEWIVGVTVGRSHDQILGVTRARMRREEAKHIVPPVVTKAETFYIGLVVDGDGQSIVEKKEHRFGNTQIQIAPTSSAAASLNAARDFISDDDLMGDGKDIDPNHITVRFGLLNDDLDQLRMFIARQVPFQAALGEVELFKPSEHSDWAVPVVVQIISPELHAIEAEIGKHADFKEKSFPDYKPHCTLAYVKPEAAPAYQDVFMHGTFIVQSITISHASGVKETIPFGMTQKRQWVEAQHPRNEIGRFTESLHGPQDALDSLLNGEKANIDQHDVHRFLEKTLEQGEDPNLIHLHIEGKSVFDGKGRIERKDMPQVPKEHRQNFLKEMRDAGVEVTEETVDPLKLKPTQNEIGARNVAEKLQKYEKGNRVFPPLLVSKEGRILDGHHHWGMMAVFALDHPQAKVPIYRLNISTKDALAKMHAYDKKHGIERKALGQKYDPDQPRDEDGKFTSYGTMLQVSQGSGFSQKRHVVLRTEKGWQKVNNFLVQNNQPVGAVGEVIDISGMKVEHTFQTGIGDTISHTLELAALPSGTKVVLSGADEDRVFEKQGDHWISPEGKSVEYYHFDPKTIKTWVKKADPATGRYVTPFVSFEKQGNAQLQLIASLNSSRLATWGFTAEAEVRGMARYRISAVLDGRTSDFCRAIDGKVFYVEDAREKVIEVLNVQDPNDLKTVQPWPKQTKAAIAEFRQMSSEELTERGFHIPPYHPYCRTICRVVQASEGEAMEAIPMIPAEAETFQPMTAADLKELGVDATQEQVDQWNEHVGMSPVELLSKLSGMPPQEVMTKGKGVGANPIRFDEAGNIGFNVHGADPKGVEFKLGAILDPFTGTYYLTQAELLAGNPKAELAFMKNLFSSLIEMGLKSSATSVAVGVAGNAAYYAKLGFLPDELEWNAMRKYALGELEAGKLEDMLKSLLPEDRLLVQHLLEDRSVGAMSALIDLPFTYEGKTIGEWLFGEATGIWALDLTDDLLVAQARAYLS